MTGYGIIFIGVVVVGILVYCLAKKHKGGKK